MRVNFPQIHLDLESRLRPGAPETPALSGIAAFLGPGRTVERGSAGLCRMIKPESREPLPELRGDPPPRSGVAEVLGPDGDQGGAGGDEVERVGAAADAPH